jgi:tRNA-dihydrouridine synthase
MVRNKGRGSGILRTPAVFRSMLEVGCDVMGPGRFSIKTRLGVDRGDELLELVDIINGFPLRFVTLHARTARQMYSGECDAAMARTVAAACTVPVVENGDIDWRSGGGMVGRSFVRHLGELEHSRSLVERYIESSRRELGGERGVLGRMKELVQYWKELPAWRRRWQAVKVSRSLAELELAIR